MLVETSAHQNVNVEQAFLALAQAIERVGAGARVRPTRSVTYVEAARAREEVVEVAREAFLALLRGAVLDYRAAWDHALQRRLTPHPDYAHFIELCGTERAAQLFRAHIARLRGEFVAQRQAAHLRRLHGLMQHILPDLSTISDRWVSCTTGDRRVPCTISDR